MIEESKYRHDETYIASSQTHALAVGSHRAVGSPNAVELLDLSSWAWETKTPYPFESNISNAPIIYLGKKFIMFGGWNSRSGPYLSRVTVYTPHTDEWKTEGNLLTPRNNAGVMTVDNDSFLIIGGFTSGDNYIKSEKCVYKNDQLECSYQSPDQPQLLTHLFAVSSEYCQT